MNQVEQNERALKAISMIREGNRILEDIFERVQEGGLDFAKRVTGLKESTIKTYVHEGRIRRHKVKGECWWFYKHELLEDKEQCYPTIEERAKMELEKNGIPSRAK